MSEEVDQLLTALGRFDVVDLSHPLEESMPVFPVLSKYYHMLWFSTTHGDAATAYQFLMNEHCGTHYGHAQQDRGLGGYSTSDGRSSGPSTPKTWRFRAPGRASASRTPRS